MLFGKQQRLQTYGIQLHILKTFLCHRYTSFMSRYALIHTLIDSARAYLAHVVTFVFGFCVTADTYVTICHAALISLVNSRSTT